MVGYAVQFHGACQLRGNRPAVNRSFVVGMKRGVLMISANAKSCEPVSPRVSHAIPVVFVVDDDASVRKSLELLIDSAGWQVETFACAQEFLSCPRASVPSCLVLDLTLPD